MRKTIVIYTQDNRAYAGATPLDVVSRMLEANVFTIAKTPDEYMRGVASRTLALEGVTVSCTTPDAFLQDLADAGIIEISEGH